MIFLTCNTKIHCTYSVLFILHNKFNKRNCKLLSVFFQNITDPWTEVAWRCCWSREYWTGLGVGWVSRCNQCVSHRCTCTVHRAWWSQSFLRPLLPDPQSQSQASSCQPLPANRILPIRNQHHKHAIIDNSLDDSQKYKSLSIFTKFKIWSLSFASKSRNKKFMRFALKHASITTSKLTFDTSLGAGLPGTRAVVMTTSHSSHCLAYRAFWASWNSCDISLMSLAQPPSPAPDS